MIKRTIYSTPLLLILIFTFGHTATHAQNMEIGYVDPQAILSNMPEMSAVQQRLQNFVEDEREGILEARQEFQTALESYQQQQAVLSEEARLEEEQALEAMQAELQQAQREAQQAIQQRQQELVGPLLESINNAISDVAEQQGLTYVINTTTSNGDVIILYASEEAQQQYDITDAVMDNLGI